jgi:hypothetical protein
MYEFIIDLGHQMKKRQKQAVKKTCLKIKIFFCYKFFFQIRVKLRSQISAFFCSECSYVPFFSCNVFELIRNSLFKLSLSQFKFHNSFTYAFARVNKK